MCGRSSYDVVTMQRQIVIKRLYRRDMKEFRVICRKRGGETISLRNSSQARQSVARRN